MIWRMQTMRDRPTKLNRRGLATQFILRKIRNIPGYPSQKAYRITASHAGKFLWFRVPKVCTRTIYQILQNSEYPLDIGHAAKMHYPVDFYQDYFKFAFVRNPWDRMVAIWTGLVVDSNYLRFDHSELLQVRQNFGHFVEWVGKQDLAVSDQHIRPQDGLVDLNEVDFLGRYETFESDLGEVLSRIGISLSDIPRINQSSKRKDYRTYYTPDVAEAVGHIYRREIQILNYKFDP